MIKVCLKKKKVREGKKGKLKENIHRKLNIMSEEEKAPNRT